MGQVIGDVPIFAGLRGLFPGSAEESHVLLAVMSRAKADPGYRLTVDLERCRITDGEEFDVAFTMHSDPETHEFRRYCLLNGLDEIDIVLRHEKEIAVFENRPGPHRRTLKYSRS